MRLQLWPAQSRTWIKNRYGHQIVAGLFEDVHGSRYCHVIKITGVGFQRRSVQVFSPEVFSSRPQRIPILFCRSLYPVGRPYAELENQAGNVKSIGAADVLAPACGMQWRRFQKHPYHLWVYRKSFVVYHGLEIVFPYSVAVTECPPYVLDTACVRNRMDDGAKQLYAGYMTVRATDFKRFEMFVYETVVIKSRERCPWSEFRP